MNDLIQSMVRNLYVRAIKEVKIDEYNLEDFYLDSYERTLLDRLCMSVKRYDLTPEGF